MNIRKNKSKLDNQSNIKSGRNAINSKNPTIINNLPNNINGKSVQLNLLSTDKLIYHQDDFKGNEIENVERNKKSNNQINNLNDSQSVTGVSLTASFYTNYSIMAKKTQKNQIRRNRYNKTYSQIYKEKHEYSRSNDENSYSILNQSKKGNTINASSDMKFDHRQLKNKTYATLTNFSLNKQEKSTSRSQNLSILHKKTNSNSQSQNGSIDFDMKTHKIQNTQISNPTNNRYDPNYCGSNSQIYKNKTDKNYTSSRCRNSENNFANSNSKNSKKSKSLNQEKLKNNLIKMKYTGFTPSQNINMRSLIKNLLTETNKFNNKITQNNQTSTNAIIEDYNIRVNTGKLSTNNNKDEDFLFESIKTKNLNFATIPIEQYKNNVLVKSLSSIEMNNQIKKNSTPKSNFSQCPINNFDNTLITLNQKENKQFFVSNENFYKKKNTNTNIGVVKLQKMSITDPRTFKTIKYSENNSNNIDNFASINSRSPNNIDSMGYYNSNRDLNEVKSSEYNVNDQINNYPKRDYSLGIASPICIPYRNNSGYQSPAERNNNPSKSQKIIISNSGKNGNLNQSGTQNNILIDDIVIDNDLNYEDIRANNKEYMTNKNKNEFYSPKNKNETSKAKDDAYDNPRLKSKEDEDELTLIEETDEKIAGHISEENIINIENNKSYNKELMNNNKNNIHCITSNLFNLDNPKQSENSSIILKNTPINLNDKSLKNPKNNEIDKFQYEENKNNLYVNNNTNIKIEVESKTKTNKYMLGKDPNIKAQQIFENQNTINSDAAYESRKLKSPSNLFKNNPILIKNENTLNSKTEATNLSLSNQNFNRSNWYSKNQPETELVRLAKTDDKFYASNNTVSKSTAYSNKDKEGFNNYKILDNKNANSFSPVNKSHENYNNNVFSQKINPKNINNSKTNNRVFKKKNLKKKNSAANSKNNSKNKNNLSSNNKSLKIEAGKKTNDCTYFQVNNNKDLNDYRDETLTNNKLNAICNQTEEESKTININLNKVNIPDDSFCHKRNNIVGISSAKKSYCVFEDQNNKSNSNNNPMNLKTENIRKYINDQEDKISNFDNININFSPNRYSRISMSSFRESCDFEFEKHFSNSISNNEDIFANEEVKKSITKKLINPKLLLNNIKNQKNNLKNIVNNLKYNPKSNKNFKLDDKANLKAFSNSFSNSVGSHSLIKNKIIEKNQTSNKNVTNQTHNALNTSKNSKIESDRPTRFNSNKIIKALKSSKSKNHTNGKSINNKSLSRTLSLNELKNGNRLNQSHLDLNNKNIFQRVISKSTRGKNYYFKTENDNIINENKKKIYKDFELAIVPINNVILNYKYDADDSKDNSIIARFKKDLILPTHLKRKIRTIFQKKITSKIENRSYDANNNFTNYNTSSKSEFYPKDYKTFSPSDFRKKINKLKKMKLFISLSPKRNLHDIYFSPIIEKKIDLKYDLIPSFKRSHNSNFSNGKISFKNPNDKFNEIKNRFESSLYNSPEKFNSGLLYSSSHSNFYNNKMNSYKIEGSKNLRDIKNNLEILKIEMDKENRMTKLFSKTTTNKLFNKNPKFNHMLGNIESSNFDSQRKFRFEINKNEKNNNFIYDINANNLYNDFNTINSFSFHNSPKNKSVNNNDHEKFNKLGDINDKHKFKISHPTNLNYIPGTNEGLNSNEKFQNNIMKRLIDKSETIKTLKPNYYDTLTIHNTVNETINSIQNQQASCNKNLTYKDSSNNKQNDNTFMCNLRSKSWGRTTKFMPELMKKSIFGGQEDAKIQSENNNFIRNENNVVDIIYNSKEIKNNMENNYNCNNYNNLINNVTLDKNYIYNKQEEEIFDKQINDLKHNIRKIKQDSDNLKSPNRMSNDNNKKNFLENLNNPEYRHIKTKSNLNSKVKKFIEENKFLLLENLSFGKNTEADLTEKLHGFSRNKLRSPLSISNFRRENCDLDNYNSNNEFNALNTVSNTGLNKMITKDNNKITKNLKVWKEFDLISNKSNKKNLLTENTNLSSKFNSKTNENLSGKKLNSKLNFDDKINNYIDSKIEYSKEIKSARYTNEKQIEDMNKKFIEKKNNFQKPKMFTSDEEYKSILLNLKHKNQNSVKEYINYKNKKLEEEILISDEKISEFKDKFFTNFRSDIDRENLNILYKKLVSSANSNKDSIFAALEVDMNKTNQSNSISHGFQTNNNFEEKLVNQKLDRLKSLLNLEDKNLREMKFYKNENQSLNSNSNMMKSYKSDFYNITNKVPFRDKLDSNKINFNLLSNDVKVSSFGNSHKLALEVNNANNSVLPKNDLGLEEMKIKNLYHNSNYKFNF